MDYYDFLKSKVTLAPQAGLPAEAVSLHPSNFPHQNDAIRWAAEQGRALIAMNFGLGKTLIQCELARIIAAHTGQPFLIICPLGVRHQFMLEDGRRLGMDIQHVRTDAEADAATSPYLITNYERVRDGGLTPATIDRLGGVCLDEGAVLRSLDSKTSDVFKTLFANTRYRFVATATPSPNDYKELIYYAEFLGVMDHGQALTRWFKRDPQKAGHLMLMPSQTEAFWTWVSSWALFVSSPADLGHDASAYQLPPLNVHWTRIAVDQTRAQAQRDNRGQGRLLLDAAAGVREATAEKRATLPERLRRALALIAEHPAEQWIIWCHLNSEQQAVEKALAERDLSCSSIYGSLAVEETERRLYAWKDRTTQVLLSKPVMLGAGLNLQQCHRVIFLGIDYKFAAFIQALHRTYRFLQTEPVEVHILFAESEEQIVSTLKVKWQQHNDLMDQMRALIAAHGLSHSALEARLSRSLGVARMETKSDLFTLVNNDCVEETRRMEADCVDLLHTSIPFGNHYEYVASLNDFGHNPTDAAFWVQMDYLIPELLRVVKPGRLAAVHVKDRILYGHQTPTGFMEVAPFSDECVSAFRRHGWLYEGRRTIVTDVVRENNSTYRLGWTEMTKDASKMGAGLPEYLLLFRKPPSDPVDQRADEPVTKDKADYSRARWQVDAHSFWRSNGNGPLTLAELYDYEAHVGRLEAMERTGNLPASFFYEPPVSKSAAVWDDVTFMRTLNTDQSRRREENHVCPLPFDIVERVIRLYSNPGELVFDPFAGLGTVVMLAMRLGRRGFGSELNPDYYAAAVRYCQAEEQKVKLPSLFDLLDAMQSAQQSAPVLEA